MLLGVQDTGTADCARASCSVLTNTQTDEDGYTDSK